MSEKNKTFDNQIIMLTHTEYKDLIKCKAKYNTALQLLQILGSPNDFKSKLKENKMTTKSSWDAVVACINARGTP